MIGLVTAEGHALQAELMEKARQAPLTQADSPGDRSRAAASPLPRSLGGKHSRRSDFAVTVEHVDLATLTPKHLADLRTFGPDASGTSYDENPGRVSLAQLDQAGAASSRALRGNPSGNPGHRPGFAPAPSGHGERFGRTPAGADGPAACAVPGRGFVG